MPGHVAASYLSSRYLKTDLGVAIAASLFPDVVDKLGYYVFRTTLDARLPAHTLAGLGATLLVVWIIGTLFRRPWLFAYSWALAYGLHLVFDVLNGPVHFLWPFVSYHPVGYESVQENWAHAVLFQVLLTVIVETCLTLWALVVWRRQRRDTHAQGRPSVPQTIVAGPGRPPAAGGKEAG